MILRHVDVPLSRRTNFHRLQPYWRAESPISAVFAQHSPHRPAFVASWCTAELSPLAEIEFPHPNLGYTRQDGKRWKMENLPATGRAGCVVRIPERHDIDRCLYIQLSVDKFRLFQPYWSLEGPISAVFAQHSPHRSALVASR